MFIIWADEDDLTADGGRKYVWNVGQFLWDYAAQHPIKYSLNFYIHNYLFYLKGTRI